MGRVLRKWALSLVSWPWHLQSYENYFCNSIYCTSTRCQPCSQRLEEVCEQNGKRPFPSCSWHGAWKIKVGHYGPMAGCAESASATESRKECNRARRSEWWGGGRGLYMYKGRCDNLPGEVRCDLCAHFHLQEHYKAETCAVWLLTPISTDGSLRRGFIPNRLLITQLPFLLDTGLCLISLNTTPTPLPFLLSDHFLLTLSWVSSLPPDSLNVGVVPDSPDSAPLFPWIIWPGPWFLHRALVTPDTGRPSSAPVPSTPLPQRLGHWPHQACFFSRILFFGKWLC